MHLLIPENSRKIKSLRLWLAFAAFIFCLIHYSITSHGVSFFASSKLPQPSPSVQNELSSISSSNHNMNSSLVPDIPNEYSNSDFLRLAFKSVILLGCIQRDSEVTTALNESILLLDPKDCMLFCAGRHFSVANFGQEKNECFCSKNKGVIAECAPQNYQSFLLTPRVVPIIQVNRYLSY